MVPACWGKVLEAPASAFDSKWCSSSDMVNESEKVGNFLKRAEKKAMREWVLSVWIIHLVHFLFLFLIFVWPPHFFYFFVKFYSSLILMWHFSSFLFNFLCSQISFNEGLVGHLKYLKGQKCSKLKISQRNRWVDLVEDEQQTFSMYTSSKRLDDL